MTQDQSRTAVLAVWNSLPALERRSASDAVAFAMKILNDQPALTNFECSGHKFPIIRSWVLAAQRLRALS